MNISEFIETLKLAFASLQGAKLRSALASIGVVIGISIVIIVGWAIRGLDNAMNDTFNSIGVDMIYIDKWDWAGGKSWKEVRARNNITYPLYKEFEKRIESAELVFPTARKWGGSLIYNNEEYQGISVNGTTANVGITPAGETIEGRFFNQVEENNNINVIVLGYNVSQNIFKGESPIGKIVKVGGFKFEVIGVLKKQGGMFVDFLDNQVHLPIDRFMQIFGNPRRSVSIGVKAGSIEKLDEVRTESIGAFRTIRNLAPDQPDDFSINETKTFQSAIENIRFYVYVVGLGMTMLSFLVGIIGIMNIMFVSVTERTKEIGIRKAIGAKKRSILLQFIAESSALCFAGALISLVVCSVLVFAIAKILPIYVPETAFLKPYLPFELLVIASVVSIFVGILAGLIPAIRASNLDPVEALRFE